MRRIINIGKISDLITFMIQELDNIYKTKELLSLDIKKISDCYYGNDSTIIQSKYNETLNQTNAIIITLENYISYLKSLLGNYQDNLLKTNNNLNSFFDDIDKLTINETSLLNISNLDKNNNE